MSTFENYLKEQLKDDEFRKEYYKAKFFSEIGVQIVKLRLKLHLSQAELAKKAGTTQAVVSRIENGSVSVTVGTIQKLAEAMDSVVNIEFLSNSEMRHLETYSDLFFTFPERITDEDQENEQEYFPIALIENEPESRCYSVTLTGSYQSTKTDKRVVA